MWNKLKKILFQILINIKNTFQQIITQIFKFIRKYKQYFYLFFILFILMFSLLILVSFWNTDSYILLNNAEQTQTDQEFSIIKDRINFLRLRRPTLICELDKILAGFSLTCMISAWFAYYGTGYKEPNIPDDYNPLEEDSLTKAQGEARVYPESGSEQAKRYLFNGLLVIVGASFGVFSHIEFWEWYFNIQWFAYYDNHLINIQDFHFIKEIEAIAFYDNPDLFVQFFKIRRVTEQLNALLIKQREGTASSADLENYRVLLQLRHKLIWELYCKQTNQEIPFVEQVITKSWWLKYLKFTSLLIFSRFPRIHSFVYLLKLTFTAKKTKIKIMNLNFGPQHPSAHGVLRLILDLNGEIIKKATPHIGLLHRGTEKLVEYKTYQQSLPYFDRLDYVSMMAQEHTFSLSIEKLKKIKISLQASLKRIIFLEITRILNHLMAITTHALDVGALTPFLYAFEEREKLFEFYERVSGTRMHAAYIRPAGLQYDLPFNMLCDILYFIHSFQSRVDEIEELLSNNRIWKQRLKFVGVLKKNDIKYWSFSGVMSRSVGLNYDIRQDNSYEGYSALWWHAPLGVIGDSFARYIQRAKEMRNSLYISQFCTNFIKNNNWDISKFKVRFLDKIICSTLPRVLMKSKMEELIKHFKFSSIGYNISTNTIYISTEAPKGEFGVFLASNNSPKPYRLKIKAPGFLHLQGLDIMTKEHLLADAVTIIGTQDIVFGEVDR